MQVLYAVWHPMEWPIFEFFVNHPEFPMEKLFEALHKAGVVITGL